MIEGIEMANHEGTCRFCGDIQPILAVDQIDADNKISEKCYCDGYKKEQRLIRAEEAIDSLLGCGAKEKGLKEEDHRAVTLLKKIAEAINEDVIQSVAVNTGGAKVSLSMTAKEKIKVVRTDTEQYSAEA